MQTPDIAWFNRNWPRWLEEWKTLLRFPSISADPGHRDACRMCAQWLGDHLRELGFAVRIMPTASNPVVIAQRPGDDRAAPEPVLFYGHYDVQPTDPASAWESPPFEPALRNGRLYARGAQDNKGQMFAVIKAIEMLCERQVPLPPLTLLLEGDEENGRNVLETHLEQWRDLLAARVLLVCDTDSAGPDRPAIVMGLRGIVTLTVAVTGARHDLHSGLHGGIAPNPAAGLARLLTSLHDDKGRIAVADFDTDVLPPSDEERRRAIERPGLGAEYRNQTGVDPFGDEHTPAPAERLGFRPCIDINGLVSGHTGEGSKTIIPARAVAKLSARLAAGQDPAAALQRLRAHLERHAPRGLSLAITDEHIGGPALRVALDAPAIAQTRTVLRNLYGIEPLYLWEGASIPVLSQLVKVSGADPVLVGFGGPEDRIHAPNESFAIDSFRNACLFAAAFLRAR